MCVSSREEQAESTDALHSHYIRDERLLPIRLRSKAFYRLLVPLGLLLLLLLLLLRPAPFFALIGLEVFILVLALLLCLFADPLGLFDFALLGFGSSATLGFLAFFAILAIAACASIAF